MRWTEQDVQRPGAEGTGGHRPVCLEHGGRACGIGGGQQPWKLMLVVLVFILEVMGHRWCGSSAGAEDRDLHFHLAPVQV